MENTLENKRKFFAQYWGQEIGFYYRSKINNHKNHCLIGDFGSIVWVELKSLSDITDEDAIKVGEILKMNYKKDFLIKEVKDWIDCRFGFGHIKHRFECLQVFDYLRLKGYAVPYMGLSVEKLIEYGWVTLKNDNNENRSNNSLHF